MADYPIERALQHLNNSGIVKENNALYQAIKELINAARSGQEVTNQILNPEGGSTVKPAFAPRNSTYLTATNQVPFLPRSVQLIAGSGITFDDSIKNVRKISAGFKWAFNNTVTDAQFKALPSGAYIELVPAPGIGKCIIPQWAYMQINAITPYTNVDPRDLHGQLGIAYGDWSIDCFNMYEWFDGSSARFMLMPAHQLPNAAELFDRYIDTTYVTPPENMPLK